MGNILKRTRDDRIYYVYQETYREKIDNNNKGKTKGTGKSIVKTKAIYLGTAEHILKAVITYKKTKQ